MYSVLEWVLSNALAATILAVGVALVGRWIKWPALMHLLWGLVLIRLLMPPISAVSLDLPTMTEPPTPPSEIIVPIPTEEPTSEQADPFPAAFPELLVPEMAEVPESDLPAPVSEDPVPTPDIFSTAASASSIDWLRIAFWVWLVGVGGVWVLALVRVVRFQRALRQAESAPTSLQRECERYAQRLGLKKSPRVCLVPGRVPPFLWSTGARRLVLPKGLVERLGTAELGSILMHELAHLRRGDLWWRRLELVVVGLYWWFPLVRWFRAKFRAAEEECCDAWVIDRLDQRRIYADALVKTVDFLSSPDPEPIPRLACGLGPVHHLKRRITVIMKGTPARRLSRWGLAVVLGLGALALSWRPVWADDEEERERPAREAPRDVERGEGERGERAERAQQLREQLERARAELREHAERVRQLERELAEVTGRPIPRGRDLPRLDVFGRPREGERGAPPDMILRRMQEMERAIQELREGMERMQRDGVRESLDRMRREGAFGPREGDRPPGGFGGFRGRPEGFRPPFGDRPEGFRPPFGDRPRREGDRDRPARPDRERGDREGARPDRERPEREGDRPRREGDRPDEARPNRDRGEREVDRPRREGGRPDEARPDRERGEREGDRPRREGERGEGERGEGDQPERGRDIPDGE